MKPDFSVDYAKLNRTKQLLGMSYGLLAGLSFTAAAWGLDALQLGRSSADYFWFKLVVGGLAALLLGGLAGWLGEKLDKGLVTFVLWLAVVLFLARLASHLPFEIFSKFLALLDPKTGGLIAYPYPSNVDRHMVIVYIVVLITGGLGGALQHFLVDAALGAATPFMRWLTVAVCIPLFLLAGSSVDGINSALRSPLVAAHDVIAFARANQGKQVDKQLATEMSLRSVERVQDLLGRPFRVVLGIYDPDYLDSFMVYINFDGEWVTCSALIDRLSNCDRSQRVYFDKLEALLTKGPDPSGALLVAGPAESWLASWREQRSQPAGLAVDDQRGAAVQVELQDQNGRAYECLLNVTTFASTRLEACSPTTPSRSITRVSPPDAAAASPIAVTATPTAGPAIAFQVDSSGFVSPEAAMLPASLPDLQGLPNLTRYNIQVSVDFDKHSFQGHSRVETTNPSQADLDRLYFRLFPNGGRSYGNGSLYVSRVSQDGQALQTSLSVGDSALEVRLATPLPAGARTSLELDFGGVTPVDFGGGYGIYNEGEGVMSLANWYPILAIYDQNGWRLDPTNDIGDSVYSQMAYYTVSLTAGSDLAVAATGVTVQRTDKDGQATYLLSSGPARDFYIALSPDFAVTSRQVAGTQVNSYYLSKDASGGAQALDIAVKALHDYSDQFGLYPYREFDVVEAPLQDALGVEYPGIILAAANVYEDPTNTTFITVIAHEVGHQWWYNVVGNDVLSDPWMDEGLTTYTSMLYFEREHGEGGYQGILGYYQDRYNAYLEKHPDDLVTASVGHYEGQAEGGAAYSTMVYTKAALFFKALRDTIGDQAFFQALQDYYRSEKYKIAAPQDLLVEFEKASGRKLGDFYQKWLYSAGTP